jgi:hypothetical protein
MEYVDTAVSGLTKLAGLGLVVAGFNFGSAAVLDFNFLAQTPMWFQGFTALGAFVGGLDSLAWYLFGVNLLPMDE